jgi:hypothetical protein
MAASSARLSAARANRRLVPSVTRVCISELRDSNEYLRRVLGLILSGYSRIPIQKPDHALTNRCFECKEVTSVAEPSVTDPRGSRGSGLRGSSPTVKEGSVRGVCRRRKQSTATEGLLQTTP